MFDSLSNHGWQIILYVYGDNELSSIPYGYVELLVLYFGYYLHKL